MERRSRDFYRKLVARFERSGMTQKRFAQEHAVRLGTLQHWVYKLRREGTGSREQAPQLLPVHVVDMPPARAPLEVVLPNGLVLRWAGDAPVSVVAATVEVLARVRAC